MYTEKGRIEDYHHLTISMLHLASLSKRLFVGTRHSNESSIHLPFHLHTNKTLFYMKRFTRELKLHVKQAKGNLEIAF